jgi:hypothetical protein
MRFTTFVGVDQTGAVVGGRPRPLPAVRLVRGDTRWSLESGSLAAASRDELLAFAADEAPAIALDAVLGLPLACWQGEPPFVDSMWSLLGRASRTSGYGRAHAESFFASFTPVNGEKLPRRACDTIAKANSILATRPFQKNVQTGTFRIWKDLTRDGVRWANLWPFDDVRTASKRRPWLFEGYPSFLWARLFGFQRRAPMRFAEVIVRARALGVDIAVTRALLARLTTDADLADAAVLAIGAACLDVRGRLFRPFARFSPLVTKTEGWIMGVTQPASIARSDQRGSQRGGRRSK